MGKITQSCDEYTADYVIVGVGTAGSIMARRLSDEKGVSVVGVEAGNNNIYDKPINDAAFAGVEFNLVENYYPEYFWQQKPVPNGSLVNPVAPADSTLINCSSIPINQSTTNPGDYTTGRILGGGSSINGQQYVRGSNEFYNRWSAIAGPLWSDSSALQGYKELEHYYGDTIDPSIHGYTGPMSIRQAPATVTSMSAKFVEAVVNSTGFPEIPADDYNNPATVIGPFGKWELFQYPNGTRAGAAEDFLNPSVIDGSGRGLCKRELQILFKTTALRIIWDQQGSGKCKRARAVGITALSNGRCIKVYARKEVIVCLGIYSSQFLQGSGVGPAPLLKCLGIPLIYDNPLVGKGFTNQLIVTAAFTANPADVSVPADDLAALYNGGAFLPPLIPQDNPLLRGYQLIGGSAGPGSFFIFVIHLQPKSEGELRVQSTDPLTVSLVDNNYLGNPLDVQAYVAAFQTYVREIAVALAAIDPAYQLVSPTIATIDDTDLLTDYITENFEHTHHWMTSNRMSLTPETGVTDPVGRVWGVKGLRIVDNSIIPTQNDGNTAAPVFLAAWKISGQILGYDSCKTPLLPTPTPVPDQVRIRLRC